MRSAYLGLGSAVRMETLLSTALVWPPGAWGPLFSVVAHPQQARVFPSLTHHVCVTPGHSKRVHFLLSPCSRRTRCTQQPALMLLPGAGMVHFICTAAHDKAKQTLCRPRELWQQQRGSDERQRATSRYLLGWARASWRVGSGW